MHTQLKLSFLSLLLCFLTNLSAQNLPKPSGLICEYLRAPEAAVITDNTPEFGWIFPQSGGKQAAYKVLVASSPYLLKEGKADYWDSKKVEVNQSINVEYGGKQLTEHSVYWWQVKVWSVSGLESEYSAPQQFITGNFDRSDLEYSGQSRWIELAAGEWVSENKQSATFHRYKPTFINHSTSGSYFADFGKSVIGILEFSATTKVENTPITVFLGERKIDDQTVHKNPGKSNIGYQKVEITLKKGTHHYVVKLAERGPSHYLHSQKTRTTLSRSDAFSICRDSGKWKCVSYRRCISSCFILLF